MTDKDCAAKERADDLQKQHTASVLTTPFDPLLTEQIALDVQKELMRARMGHGPMRSKHEGYAVLLEEVREVEQEVFHGKDNSKLRAELIQVAAMAQRMIEDLRL